MSDGRGLTAVGLIKSQFCTKFTMHFLLIESCIRVCDAASESWDAGDEDQSVAACWHLVVGWRWGDKFRFASSPCLPMLLCCVACASRILLFSLLSLTGCSFFPTPCFSAFVSDSYPRLHHSRLPLLLPTLCVPGQSFPQSIIFHVHPSLKKLEIKASAGIPGANATTQSHVDGYVLWGDCCFLLLQPFWCFWCLSLGKEMPLHLIALSSHVYASHICIYNLSLFPSKLSWGSKE